MASSDSSLKLSSTVEYQNVAKVASDLYLMASLKAPVFSNPDEARVPIDLVCVIDRSGSMSGTKIELVKSTLDFMIGQLAPTDRLGLVSFDTGVTVDSPLVVMSEENKKTTATCVSKLTPGSSTNLSGGLFQGVDLLCAREGGNDVASVLLFTDGQANHGITGTAQIVEALAEKMRLSPRQISVFSFGFGEDHDANMLKGIAETGHGMYYYIANADEIPKSFGDCLGGLLSVVAQNVKLKISALNGATIKKVFGNYACQDIVANQQVQVTIPDMYSEERKDVVLQIQLPSISADAAALAALSPADAQLLEQLIENAKQGNFAVVSTLLPHTSHLINLVPASRSYGVIHQAAWHKENGFPVLQALLALPSINVNLRTNKESETPLHVAARQGHLPSISALLAAGANPCAVNSSGKMARDLAQTEDIKNTLATAEAAFAPSEGGSSSGGSSSAPVECDIIKLEVEYFNVLNTTLETCSEDIKVTRVDNVPVGQLANFELDKQRNRIEMAEVLKQANALSSAGKLEEGKKLLTQAIEKIRSSVSASDPFCVSLVRDLQSCLASMTSMHEYRARGSKMMSETSHVQSYQRSTHAAYMTSGDTYRTVAKGARSKEFEERRR